MMFSLKIYWTLLACCSISAVCVSAAKSDATTAYGSDMEWGTPEYYVSKGFNANGLPDLSILSDEIKQKQVSMKWANQLEKNRSSREAQWSAALHEFEALPIGTSKRRKSRFMQILDIYRAKVGNFREENVQNYQIVDNLEEGKIISVSGGRFIKTTSVQFRLDGGKLTTVNAMLSCDPYNTICKDMLLKLHPSVRSMLDNVMRYLVAPMAAQYRHVTAYPLSLHIDIRLESPYDRRHNSLASGLVPASSTSGGTRVITIQLPYVNKLARSYSKDAIWREIMGTVTHEVTHLFQWYNHRLQPTKQPGVIHFGSPLGVWPFGRSNSLSDNSFQAPASVPTELLEGIADYVVVRSGLEKLHWRRPTSSKELAHKWQTGTYHRAFFFEWLEMRIGEGTVGRLMGSVLDSGYAGSYPEAGTPCGLEYGTWESVTGMSAQDLWKEYGLFVDTTMRQRSNPHWTWAQVYFILFVLTTCYLIFRDVKWHNSWTLNQWTPDWEKWTPSWATTSVKWTSSWNKWTPNWSLKNWASSLRTGIGERRAG
ncbi:peptidase of plants and bacteria-domain-containing protein [Penicillium waksmanii]|uniref:peptidase of plants and bacteria-domain-containing protein n=1 Tax=Penicillium waksmanii TaxID=69791 RepID=UPI002547A684|nr:peptidase of plants and bacteria-domain-containing protein [Penicillium waksmanii]KAJ5975706.1 peptidase of plants and bacteria-domain-containing protein [Penicillium waksmanii]